MRNIWKTVCEQAQIKTCKNIDIAATFQVLLEAMEGNVELSYEQLKIRARRLYLETFHREIPEIQETKDQGMQKEDILQVINFALEDMETILAAIEELIAVKQGDAIDKSALASCEQKLGILLEYLSDILLELVKKSAAEVKQDDGDFLEQVEPFMYGLYEFEADKITLNQYYERCISFYRFYSNYVQAAVRDEEQCKIKYVFDWSCGPLLFRTDIIRARCLLK